MKVLIISIVEFIVGIPAILFIPYYIGVYIDMRVSTSTAVPVIMEPFYYWCLGLVPFILALVLGYLFQDVCRYNSKRYGK